MTSSERATGHLSEAEKHYNQYLETNSPQDRCLALWNLQLARNVAPNNTAVLKLMDKLDAEQGEVRPKLQSESVLWKRMRQGGVLDDLPAPLPPVEGQKKEICPGNPRAHVEVRARRWWPLERNGGRPRAAPVLQAEDGPF